MLGLNERGKVPTATAGSPHEYWYRRLIGVQTTRLNGSRIFTSYQYPLKGTPHCIHYILLGSLIIP